MDRTLMLLAGVLGALAVALGAFGAHALEGRIPTERLATWDTASRYHLVHALALAIAAVAASGTEAPWLRLAGWLFVAGTLIFSGTLYALSLTGLGWLGAVTPIGGLLLIGGWLCLVLAARGG